MNFKNSSIYVQRKINVMLRIYKIFARAYVNDIMIFNRTLKKHIVHLHAILYDHTTKLQYRCTIADQSIA